jgi:Holliday junction resolvasome RuvABC endonuclease subunit
MIKSLNKLQKNLGKKVRRGLSIGIDLASVTGICFIEINKDIVKTNFDIFKLPKVENPKENIPTILESLVYFVKELEKKVKVYKIKPAILVIEKCYIGKNAHTALILSAFAGVVFTILHSYFDEIYFIHPMTSRKNVGLTIAPKLSRKERKEKVVEFVNNILEVKLTSDDLADAFVYAINGLIK